MVDINDFLQELEKIEVLFSDEQNNSYKFKSYIKVLESESMLIEPPATNAHLFTTKDNQEIQIILPSKEGIYTGNCFLLGRSLSSLYGYRISYPHSTQFMQRREYLRINLNYELDFVVYADKDQTEKYEFKATSRDISGSGISYISEEPLMNYYDIYCTIHINDGGNPITIRCEHVDTRQIKVSNNIKYLNALAYIDISERDVERIVKECFKQQLKMRQIKNLD